MTHSLAMRPASRLLDVSPSLPVHVPTTRRSRVAWLDAHAVASVPMYDTPCDGNISVDDAFRRSGSSLRNDQIDREVDGMNTDSPEDSARGSTLVNHIPRANPDDDGHGMMASLEPMEGSLNEVCPGGDQKGGGGASRDEQNLEILSCWMDAIENRIYQMITDRRNMQLQV